MTVAAHRTSPGDERLRIAITSPDILAQIRRVFADNNLAVDIVAMPYVEVAVRPAGDGARPPAAGRDPAGGPGPSPSASASPTVLRAEYQLSVIPASETSEDRPENTGTFRLPEGGGREITLSPRQRDVMTLMSRSARNAEIAEALHVTEKTVKNHINRIFRELGVNGRVEAVLLWQRLQAQAVAAGRWDAEGQ